MNLIQVYSHHVDHPFQKKMLEKIWEPINILGKTCMNRIALAPIAYTYPKFVHPDMDEGSIGWHEACARGGTGMVVVGEADITPNSQGTLKGIWPGGTEFLQYTKGIWSDECIPGWKKMADAMHKWGAWCVPQLNSYASWIPGQQQWIQRARAKGSFRVGEETGMTPEKLEAEVQNYITGAVRAQEAGCDAVQCHGTRETLVAMLVSERRNPGVKGYCEGFKERLRFPTECIRGIKKACGKDYPIMQRMSATEYLTGGYTVEYAKLVAKEYVDAGVDILDVAQAGFGTEVPQLEMVDPPGAYSYLARAVKSYLNSLGPPYSKVIITNTCRIQNPWVAASMLRRGDCDMVSVCRQIQADPEWGNKIKEGRIDDIVPCIGCVWCLGGGRGGPQHGYCAVNPHTEFALSKSQTPEEFKKIRITKARKVKKVLVAGGGAAGMEAARTLALRGHKVILCEKEAALGRMLRIQSYAPFRMDVDLLGKYLSTQVRKLGVDVRCNQEVTAALVAKEKPDAVVVATGCRPELPEIPGIKKTKVNTVFAEDILLENVDVGKRVLVIDADAGHDYAGLGAFAAQFAARAACVRDDVAMHIARWSPIHPPEVVMAMANTPVEKEVTIVTRRGRIADVHAHHWTTVTDLKRMGVRVIVGCEYKEINDKGLVITWGGKEELLAADTIVTASYESNNKLYKELEGKVPELHLIGDAKAVRTQLMGSVHEAYRLALTI